MKKIQFQTVLFSPAFPDCENKKLSEFIEKKKEIVSENIFKNRNSNKIINFDKKNYFVDKNLEKQKKKKKLKKKILEKKIKINKNKFYHNDYTPRIMNKEKINFSFSQKKFSFDSKKNFQFSNLKKNNFNKTKSSKNIKELFPENFQLKNEILKDNFNNFSQKKK